MKKMLTRTSSILILAGSLCGLVVADSRSAAGEARPNHCPQRHFGRFSEWSAPVNLGAVINSGANQIYNQTFPSISKNGLSLYFTSDRPGGVNAANPGKVTEIWVSNRVSLDAPWQTPVNLDAFNPAPVINSIGSVGVGGANTAGSNFSPDEHFMFFWSPRPHPDACGVNSSDLYVTWRINKRNDFGWQEPVNLGCLINSPQFDNAPNYFEDGENGTISMYFTSNRPGGPPGSQPDSFHIYVSTLGDDGVFGQSLPTRHEIWLLTQDEGSETAWPQGFSAVQFDRQSGDWSGRIGGKPGETVKIVAVVAPPTSVDFFRYYQNICNQGKEFEPLSRLPVECRNSDWVQTRFP